VNPFILADQTKDTLTDYLRTTFHLSDRAFENQLFHFLTGPDGMFEGPFVDLRLPFRKLDPTKKPALEIAPDFTPYAHQARAFQRLHQNQPTLVVTGTGSGKTECFLYPILDHCYKTASTPGIKAILLYPMNALASDQARRIATLLHDDPRLTKTVTAGLYVGGQGQHTKPDRFHLTDARQELRKNPPNILLTNYRMLDFLLLRPEDRELWRHNGPETLQYLVLDELHTYDGAQGSDVACLIRRLKARLQCTNLCPIGTSATIGSKSAEETAKVLREFAATVFQEPFPEDSVIGEDRLTLEEALGPLPDPKPLPETAATPETYNTAEEYTQKQMELWGEDHPFLHHLLQAHGGRLLTLEELAKQTARFHPDFAERDPERQRALLLSFLTTVSQARKITCQALLWTRELRRLTWHLEEATFRWEETGQRTAALPLLYCGECGAHLLAAVQLEGQERLHTDLRRIGQAFVDKKLECRAVQLVEDSETRLCPRCLKITDRKTCCTETQPIRLSQNEKDDDRKTFAARCPECQSDGALFFLASRAATLNSVALHHLFSSDFNTDKKALAFTDSVQDASHGAGFIGSRTYRFALRSALQATVQKATDATLADLPGLLFDDCQSAWGEEKASARLLPPDLETAEMDKQRLLTRLGWEIASEYGFSSQIGRSLERTACSLVYPNERALGNAATALRRDCQNKLFVAGADALKPAQVHHFLLGLVFRMRSRGGILHGFLDQYLAQDGNFFQLTKKRNPWMAPLPSERLPVFVTDHPSDRFDWFGAPPKRLTWYRDWAARSLGVDARDQGMRDLYSAALKHLAREGILEERAGKQGQVYGLRPHALYVTAGLTRLECPQCGHSIRVAESQLHLWDDSSCLHFRCPGRYSERPQAETYYARLYKRRPMERIFAHEHTGLLQRAEREEVEDRFKSSGRPNLLVCTPTLEMGVDVGDLSAVLACSVPPSTANFLQRMGRAGRKTGNALSLTTAQAHRPHDLYFFAQPLEMMRGQVLPPGCFLDAPEMLQRQLVAYAMDQWARQEEGISIQREVRAYLSPAGRKEFPGRFLTFYRKHRAELVEGFLRLFPDLKDDPAARVREFAATEALPERVEGAFDGVAAEREQLIRLRDHCRKAIEERRKLEPALQTEQTRDEIDDLQSSLKVLQRLIQELAEKYPLNVLTDAGVLPNYAFPEPGVTLKTVIRRGREDGVQTRELMRPASAALRELAPHNHFYAEGRKVTINQVDLGTRHQPLLEDWRLCPSCSYSARAGQPDALKAHCPRCEDGRWADQGQVQKLLRLRHVTALADLLSSRTTDFSEDRESKVYRTLDLISVSPENYCGQCHQIASLPFGFELLRGLTLREINFGLAEEGPQANVAGERVPLRHFRVCQDCGRVGKLDEPHAHAPYCRRKTKAEVLNLALYRELKSEAIRLLLPASTVEVELQLASFKAALMLGLRRHFQGNPIHLLIRRQSEPIDAQVRKHFLVLYDTVPGGTGYLAALAKPEGLREVLEKAHQALTACSCNQDPEADGCYRCLYAFQHQYELPDVSRKKAVALLGPILAKWRELETKVSLSDVSLDDRLESELEVLFQGRLLEEVEKVPGARAQETVYHGRKCFQLQLSQNRRWLLVPQWELGFCRPDFVLRPDWGVEGERPIAVFCDGREYHVCPGRKQSRLADDIKKRTRIVNEEKHWVWNATWADVDVKARNVPDLVAWLAGTGCEKGEATWKPLERRALASAVTALGDKTTPWHLIAAEGLRGARETLIRELSPYDGDLVREPNPELVGHLTRRPHARLGILWYPPGGGRRDPAPETIELFLRLFDDFERREKPDFAASWQWMLNEWNRLQFLPGLRVTSTSLLEEDTAYVEWVSEPFHPPYEVKSNPWEPLLEEAHAAAIPVLQALRAALAPLPVVGHEVMEGNRVTAEFELAWPDLRVGLTLVEDGPVPEGWRVFLLADYASAIPCLEVTAHG